MRALVVATTLGLLLGTPAPLFAGAAMAQEAAKKAPVKAVPAKGCVRRIGQAIGYTQDQASASACEVIEQMTDNWPVRVDRFSEPRVDCKPGGALGWTCVCRMEVCKAR